jgi:predicted transposase/invertase (TIGR01784 family)
MSQTNEERPQEPDRRDFDGLVRATFLSHAADLAAWILGERPVRASAGDTALATVIQRATDQLLDIELSDRPPLLLHVEFQTRGDPDMPQRMTEYLAMLLKVLQSPEHEGKQFGAVVVYLDRETYSKDKGHLRLEGVLGFRLLVRYKVIKVWEEDAETFLATGSPALWTLAPLAKGNHRKNYVKSKELILGAPEEVLSHGAKSDFLFILGGLASLTIEDAEFLKSSYLEVRRMRRNYFLDFAREEGVAEGIEKGIEKGVEKGTLAEARRSVLCVLRRRFGNPGEDLLRDVERVEDLGRLEMLLEEAAVAPTLDAFLSFLLPKQ